MNAQLPTICTKTGDDGTTSLANGMRINKDDLRIEANGTVDELNASLGILSTQDDMPKKIVKTIKRIQQELFHIGAELSAPSNEKINQEYINRLEQECIQYNEGLEPLHDFIIPGGNQKSAHAHMARTICRRAERRMVALSHQDKLNPFIIQYFNRLSDLLFLIARQLLLSINDHALII